MKLKQIKQAYKNLQLIIYKKRFLIPAKPQKPFTPYIKFISTHASLISDKVKQQKLLFPSNKKIKIDGRKFYNGVVQSLISSQHPAYIKIKENYPNQIADFNIRNDEHLSRYLKPAEYCRPTPYIYFSTKCLRQMPQSQRSDNHYQNLRLIGKKWKKMMGTLDVQSQINDNNLIGPDLKQQRIQFLAQFSKIHERQLEQYQKYVEKHQIPKIKKISAYNEFLSAKKTQLGQAKFSTQIAESYHRLSSEQKKKYEEQTEDKKKIMSRKYNQFLMRWGISHEQLQRIESVCQEYSRITQKKMRKSTKNLIEHSKDATIDPQEQ